MGAGFFGIAAGVLALVSFILSLVGVVQGRKDEANFTNALYCILAGILVSVISSVAGNAALTRLADNIGNICNGLSTYFILSAVASLAGQMAEEKLKTDALKARNIVCAGIVCVEIVKIIFELIGTQALGVITALTVIAVLLQIVAYVYYLRILARSKQTLAR